MCAVSSGLVLAGVVICRLAVVFHGVLYLRLCLEHVPQLLLVLTGTRRFELSW